MAFVHEVFSLACLIVRLHWVNSVQFTQLARQAIRDIIYEVKDLICCSFLFLLPPRRRAILRGLFISLNAPVVIGALMIWVGVILLRKIKEIAAKLSLVKPYEKFVHTFPP